MKNKKRIAATLFICLTVWLGGVGFFHTHKKIPDHLDYRGERIPVDENDIVFLYDLSWIDESGNRHHEQNIFNSIFKLIEGAERYILVDMFLFNSHGGMDGDHYDDLSTRLTDLLVRKIETSPGIAIDFITDPINTVYGGSISPDIERLRSSGINVIITGLEDLRDSNFIYSSFWRTFLQWFGNSTEGGWLPHPFSDEEKEVTLRSYLKLINFKANHRKVVLADDGSHMVTIVGSANPHGPSSAHSNMAFRVRGPLWHSVYQTEAAVASISDGQLSGFSRSEGISSSSASNLARVLTERQIKDALLENLEAAGAADSIKIAQFYLADRDIVEALISAAHKGVTIRLILDPNRDAFGYQKNGIPNRQTATELVRRSDQKIKLRWYDTHGEQFHTKLFVRESAELITVILGSANLTRRNLDNFNLELNIMVEFAPQSRIARSVLDYFNRIWTNDGGHYTVEKEVYEEDSSIKRALYRIQERFGLSTF